MKDPEASRVHSSNGMFNPDPDPLQTRVSLLNRLKNAEDAASWQHFFDTYWKLVYGVARKAGLSEVEAQDVVQETIISVARNIGKFRYEPEKCSFKSWLFTVVRSRILNHIRNNKRHVEGRVEPSEFSGTNLLETIADNAERSVYSSWDEEWKKNLTDAAINRVKQIATPLHFQIFDFSVLRGWEAEKVATALGVSRARVYLAKHRVSALVAKEVRRLSNDVV